jgi:hypothetical protein
MLLITPCSPYLWGTENGARISQERVLDEKYGCRLLKIDRTFSVC